MSQQLGPGEPHRRLEQKVGRWVGPERIPPSEAFPQGLVGEGRSISRMGAGGHALLTEYTQHVGGELAMVGHAVTVWDQADACYVMYWFAANGAPPTAFRGDFRDDMLVLVGDGPNGSRIRHRTAHTDEATMVTVSEICFEGEVWHHAFEGTYKKQGQ